MGLTATCSLSRASARSTLIARRKRIVARRHGVRTLATDLEQGAEKAEQVWWQLARTLTFVALGTAMRRGELLALRWRDVQLLEGLLTVREALVNGRFTTPKSRSSRRLLELGPRTREIASLSFDLPRRPSDAAK
jgi:integrase